MDSVEVVVAVVVVVVEEEEEEEILVDAWVLVAASCPALNLTPAQLSENHDANHGNPVVDDDDEDDSLTAANGSTLSKLKNPISRYRLPLVTCTPS